MTPYYLCVIPSPVSPVFSRHAINICHWKHYLFVISLRCRDDVDFSISVLRSDREKVRSCDT